MGSFMFCGAKIRFIAFWAVTKKSAKISLFADSFNLERCMKKVSVTVLRRVHAKIVRHIAAEVGWG